MVRELDVLERGRPLVAKFTHEGIYLKRKGEHWKSSVLCPWGAAFSAACKIKAMEDRKEKKNRRVKRGLL
jgi:hypothetical protein